jgi:stearoyl-CoA desaturase (Delta-9 desaturase)
MDAENVEMPLVAEAQKTSAPLAGSRAQSTQSKLDDIDWFASIPFLMLHVLCGLVFVTGFRWQWLALAVGSYAVRMFAITAGYHRYFSHRTFKTGRGFQFFLALLGSLSVQKGVLWWAANHRHHHRHSDDAHDVHSPSQRGFWWSHVTWILANRHGETKHNEIKDFAQFAELRWLNRFYLVPPLLLLAVMYLVGGLPWVVYVGIVPTVVLWHATFTINSLSHIFGSRRYQTKDTSRNNWILALLTFGEGWHNNHHFHQNTANQGWFWWEVDLTFYILKVLSWVGLIHGLRTVSDQTKYAFRSYSEAQKAALKTHAWYNRSVNQSA